MASSLTYSSMATAEQQITPEKAFELYKNTLNFNVISRYDPAVKQLLYTTSHCVIYKYDESTQEWVKSEFQGTLALYLREFTKVANPGDIKYADLQALFCYGLILLNRLSPNCFSLGLLPNKVTKQYLPSGLQNNGVSQMDVEINDNLIIVKNLLGEIYGLWVFNQEDRQKLYKLISFCLNNDASI